MLKYYCIDYEVLLQTHCKFYTITNICTIFCYCCLVAKSHLNLCNPITTAFQASLSFTISWSLLKLMSIESVMPANHLILCRPLLLLPSIFPSIRVISIELTFCSGQSKGTSASASVLPRNIQG